MSKQPTLTVNNDGNPFAATLVIRAGGTELAATLDPTQLLPLLDELNGVLAAQRAALGVVTPEPEAPVAEPASTFDSTTHPVVHDPTGDTPVTEGGPDIGIDDEPDSVTPVAGEGGVPDFESGDAEKGSDADDEGDKEYPQWLITLIPLASFGFAILMVIKDKLG